MSTWSKSTRPGSHPSTRTCSIHSLRDKDRTVLSAHDYDKNTSSFTRSFIVVLVREQIEHCAAAAGLSWGLSFGTWANARADVRKDAPLAVARRAKRKVVEPHPCSTQTHNPQPNTHYAPSNTDSTRPLPLVARSVSHGSPFLGCLLVHP